MNDNNDTSKNSFEDYLEKSLKVLGYLFPTTEDEVDSFEAQNKIEEVPLNYSSSSKLLAKSKHKIIERKPQLSTNKSFENLARAARKGGDIPEDILKKMKSDRDKTENGEK